MAKRPSPFNNPFGELKLPQAAPKAAQPKAAKVASRREDPATDDEAELFRLSVGEVAPLRSSRGLAPPREPPSAASIKVVNGEIEALTQLCELVAGEGPFDLVNSDEYVEGGAPGLDPRILKRLRAGDYSPQTHLDLHGRTRAEAKTALEAFIHQARLAGHRCVLVVTGRGLHSKDQIPVLKEGVQGWLTRGRVARQVLAFTTARPEDGGAGALYVLLRR